MYNSGGPIESAFCIGVSKSHKFVRHKQNFFNFPWPDDIMYHTSHQVQPPCAEHVVHKYEVLIWKDP